MLRDRPVRDLMTADVAWFAPSDDVHGAMRTMIIRDIDGAPVIDDDGTIVGLLSTADLIVEEARVHLPTVVALLGAYIELPSSKRAFDADVEKALGATVGEVMGEPVPTIDPDDTVEFAASIMHEQGVDRLTIVDGEGALVGIIARKDIVRAIVADWDESGAGTDE